MGLRDLIRRRRVHHDAGADPAAELDRWFRDQGQRLAEVRAALAQIAAARVRLDLAIAHVESRGGTAALAELPGLREEREELLARERDLRAETTRLEGEVQAVHARGERLRAAHAAAEGRARARSAAAAVARELGELNLAALRAQEAVDRSRAHAEALDEILGAPPSLPSASEPAPGPDGRGQTRT
jgi:phage shock protein A